MGKNRKKILLLTILLMAACLVLVITPAFARYFMNIVTDKSYRFTYESGNAVYVYGEHIADTGDGWKNFDSSSFLQGPDSATLEFSIANGTSREQFANRTQAVTVFLIAGSSIESSDNITVKLSYGDATYTGEPEEIKEDSYLYSTSGPGWVYRFYGNDGKELTFTLKGEEFSFENITLTIEGNVEATLLDLRVTGTYVQADN